MYAREGPVSHYTHSTMCTDWQLKLVDSSSISNDGPDTPVYTKSLAYSKVDNDGTNRCALLIREKLNINIATLHCMLLDMSDSR